MQEWIIMSDEGSIRFDKVFCLLCMKGLDT